MHGAAWRLLRPAYFPKHISIRRVSLYGISVPAPTTFLIRSMSLQRPHLIRPPAQLYSYGKRIAPPPYAVPSRASSNTSQTRPIHPPHSDGAMFSHNHLHPSNKAVPNGIPSYTAASIVPSPGHLASSSPSSITTKPPSPLIKLQHVPPQSHMKINHVIYKINDRYKALTTKQSAALSFAFIFAVFYGVTFGIMTFIDMILNDFKE